ncbi:SDR family NAD(P)-dependent oxidoreductase [Leifsonia sp. NPDC058230]|uniref:SDR family NAD(P)-dependent oxidoreductase n=1 Tax=Leifsonia sp. NPDC058230 TaxID=3346391 RepID=UPI0036DDBB0A
MDLGLAGKRAVVTGASKGIGLAIVRGLVAEGAHVVAGARTITSELSELIEEGSVEFVAVDLSDAGGAELLADAAGSGVDILVNNVGLAKTRVGGFLSVTDEQWYASLDLNLMAAVRTTRALLPGMLEAGHGTIVNTSSVNAFLADPDVIDYSAAKAALTSFAKSLSKEFGARGIRVNSVCPGPVETALWLGEGGVAQTVANATGQQPEDVARGAAAASVTGRFTHPEEVADVVLWLAGERATNITGVTVTIDGGLISTV